jgi:hypothetical protein
VELKAVGRRSQINSGKKLALSKMSGDFLGLLQTSGENAAGAATQVVSLNPFLALQEIDDYAIDQQQMERTGRHLLGRLNDIRFGLINGELDEEHLVNLKNSIKNSQIEFRFPALQQIIHEIMIRAEVELAKLEMGQAKRNQAI